MQFSRRIVEFPLISLMLVYPNIPTKAVSTERIEKPNVILLAIVQFFIGLYLRFTSKVIIKRHFA